MDDLFIFPFNGNGIEAVECLEGQFNLLGFIDDTPEKMGPTEWGYEVFPRDALQAHPTARILAVPGSPASYLQRKELIEGLTDSSTAFATVIHPGAHVSSAAEIGENVLIMAGAVITSNAKIGNHTIVLPNAVIHHDTEIGAYSIVGSGVIIAGGSQIGENVYIGAGARIANHLRIGAAALIGMGSNVLQPVAPRTTVAGNPARKI